MPFRMLCFSGVDRFLFLEQRVSRVNDEDPLAPDVISSAFEILARIVHGMFVSGA